MEVVFSDTCLECGCCFRKHKYNDKGKMGTWCSNPECEDHKKEYLKGFPKTATAEALRKRQLQEKKNAPNSN